MVFEEFIAPDYSSEGNETFKRSVTVDFMESLRNRDGFILVANVKSEIVGTLAVRDKNHIALFFVHPRLQRLGIGKALYFKMKQIIKLTGSKEISVHSSPRAVEIYEKLGFKVVEPEKIELGIRYTLMKAEITG